jgi:hypothetical protein
MPPPWSGRTPRPQNARRQDAAGRVRQAHDVEPCRLRGGRMWLRPSMSARCANAEARLGPGARRLRRRDASEAGRMSAERSPTAQPIGGMPGLRQGMAPGDPPSALDRAAPRCPDEQGRSPSPSLWGEGCAVRRRTHAALLRTRTQTQTQTQTRIRTRIRALWACPGCAGAWHPEDAPFGPVTRPAPPAASACGGVPRGTSRAARSETHRRRPARAPQGTAPKHFAAGVPPFSTWSRTAPQVR